MLTISEDLARAFERDTLRRWKSEIAGEIAWRHSVQAAEMGQAALDDWVRGAMEMLRDQGGTAWPDIRHFCLTMFAVTEGARDARALGDFVAIMAGKGDLKDRMSLLRKAFPVE